MEESLKAVIAEYLSVEVSALPDGFRFSGSRFQGSIGMYRFQAFAQKRLGLRLPAIPYGAGLEEALALIRNGSPAGAVDLVSKGALSAASVSAPSFSGLPSASAVAVAEPQGPTARPTSIAQAVPATVDATAAITLTQDTAGLGIDIENVASMPAAFDYRVHEFYESAFTASEIAYCILKPEPRVHFCGLFSAKESLKKASPEFLELPLNAIEIGHDAKGKPYYLRAGTKVNPPYSLSISHTQETAVSAVARIAFPSAPAAAQAYSQLPLAVSVPVSPGVRNADGGFREEISMRRFRRWNIALGAALAMLLGCLAWIAASGRL